MCPNGYVIFPEAQIRPNSPKKSLDSLACLPHTLTMKAQTLRVKVQGGRLVIIKCGECDGLGGIHRTKGPTRAYAPRGIVGKSYSWRCPACLGSGHDEILAPEVTQ